MCVCVRVSVSTCDLGNKQRTCFNTQAAAFTFVFSFPLSYAFSLKAESDLSQRASKGDAETNTDFSHRTVNSN